MSQVEVYFLSYRVVTKSVYTGLMSFSAVLNVRDLYTEILIRIVRLDMVKIRHYLKDLCNTKGIFEQSHFSRAVTCDTILHVHSTC